MKLCECGCGKPTKIITVNVATRGLVKGQYRRFIWGHQNKITDFWSQVDKVNGPVSNLGTRCWLWTGGKSSNGYGTKRVDGKPKSAQAVAFFLTHGKWPNRACHRCDNPPCVRPDHIFNGTAKDNAEDMVAKGRHSHGEQRWNAKLSAKQIIKIRKLYASGEVYQRELAAQYGVLRKAISDVVRGKTWKHIPLEEKK